MKKIAVIATTLALLVLFVAPVQAYVQLPHAFYGNVLINGTPAPVGTQVSATVDEGAIVPTQNPVTTMEGSYGIVSPKLLVQGDINQGTTVRFFVNGVDAGTTAIFEEGGGPTQVNLSVTINTPSGGTGGGVAPVTPKPVKVTGMTASDSLVIDKEGIVQANVTLASADGIFKIKIPKNSRLLDKDKKPLDTISSVAVSEPPASPPAGSILLAYDLGPDGATFDPPLELVFEYDPNDLPDGVTEDNLTIAWWDGDEWVSLETTVNETERTATCAITHFTVFGMLGRISSTTPTKPDEPTQTTEPTTPVVPETPTETVTSSVPTVPAEPTNTSESDEPLTPVDNGTNWGLVGGLIGGGVIVIVLLLLSFARRRD